MVQTTKTISFTKELDVELDNLVGFLNASKIDGAVTKSKIIRLAVREFLEKQQKIQRILNEHSEVNKSAEDLLRENGML
jgi:metal-responsive CopG/Arc/MetJ family transcriptional regulator